MIKTYNKIDRGRKCYSSFIFILIYILSLNLVLVYVILNILHICLKFSNNFSKQNNTYYLYFINTNIYKIKILNLLILINYFKKINFHLLFYVLIL